jgi:hypothetical protein
MHLTTGYDFSEGISALNSGRIASYFGSVSVVFPHFLLEKAKLVPAKKQLTALNASTTA